uniref:Nitric oxide synthase-interacting protein homolog n=1 Tax=Parastrongyloides trichosuri TaxID=131310 RepID=A0A0N4ZM34_PARTI
MTRHGKNSTASSVYTYAERQRDKKESKYGLIKARLGADSVNSFDCCALSLQPCKNPVISPEGYIFDKEAIALYFEQQMKNNKRKMKEWEKQVKEMEDLKRKEETNKEIEKKLELFEKSRSKGVESFVKDIPSTSLSKKRKHISVDSDDEEEAKFKKKNLYEEKKNIIDEKERELPSFWVPEMVPEAEKSLLEKPNMKILCPVSNKPLKFKNLLDVIFTEITEGDKNEQHIAGKKIRYMCPITHDLLTNTTKCVYLKTSKHVITKECYDKVIKKDMIDPINNQKMKESDVIELKLGGTGFAATNDLEAQLMTPAMQAG